MTTYIKLTKVKERPIPTEETEGNQRSTISVGRLEIVSKKK